MKFLYTDIDNVLSLGSEMNPKPTKWGNIHRFNAKAVKVYNEILSKTGAEIIISSTWKDHFTLIQLQEIFTEWAKISKAPIGVTPSFHKSKFFLELEKDRATEILEHVKIYSPESWVAIDDLDLREFLPEENFVFLSRFYEGIKQTGKKEETIEKLMVREFEDEYFSDWIDECSGNYVGWLKKFSSFNIIVSRENTAKAGLYDITKVASHINSASDPSGIHPEYWKDRERHLTLKSIKHIILKLNSNDK